MNRTIKLFLTQPKDYVNSKSKIKETINLLLDLISEKESLLSDDDLITLNQVLPDLNFMPITDYNNVLYQLNTYYNVDNTKLSRYIAMLNYLLLRYISVLFLLNNFDDKMYNKLKNKINSITSGVSGTSSGATSAGAAPAPASASGAASASASGAAPAPAPASASPPSRLLRNAAASCPPLSFMAVDAPVTFDPPKISLDHPLNVKMITSGNSPLTLHLISRIN